MCVRVFQCLSVVCHNKSTVCVSVNMCVPLRIQIGLVWPRCDAGTFSIARVGREALPGEERRSKGREEKRVG